MAKKKVNTTEDKKISDILDLLVNETYKILSWKIIDAQSPPVNEYLPDGLPEYYYNFDHKTLNGIVRMVEPLLKTVEQSKKIKVDSIKDVTESLAKGNITISEAKELIKLLSNRTDVETAEMKATIKKMLLEELDKDEDNEKKNK